MEAYLLPVKMKLLWLGIHRSLSLLHCWKDRKGMQFVKSAKGKNVKMYCPVFWLIVYVASLIQSFSNMFICSFLSDEGEDLRCVLSLTGGVNFISLFHF